MLRLLTVTNFATIERLELELGSGFTVLTGETGAGKSIIVDALSLVLGGRAESGVVRPGETRTRIEGAFSIPPPSLPAMLETLSMYGLDEDFDGELILAREINAEGRNVCRVNGRLAPLRTLSAVGSGLVDIHGQGEHLSLLRSADQLAVLDRYGGLEESRARVSALVSEATAVRRALSEVTGDEAEVARLADMLRFQVNEIEAAGLETGEDDRVRRERDLLQNAEQVSALAGQALSALTEGRDGKSSVVDQTGMVLQALLRLEEIDRSFAAQREAVEALADQAAEVGRALGAFLDGFETGGERLEEVTERLDLIAGLTRKYGPTIEDVAAFGTRAAEQLDALERADERRAELSAKLDGVLGAAAAAAAELSARRSEAAAQFGPAIERELMDLALAGTRVVIDVSPRRDEGNGVPVPEAGGVAAARYVLDASGIDAVQLLIAANIGEPLRPAVRTASGGEASRLMLAVKTVLTTADAIPTLVFDEVDSGIGGRLGATVGEKLAGLAGGHQVLCVTHLPQIAAAADRHLLVRKETANGRTVTTVRAIDADRRVEELAAMMGSTSAATVNTAREMLSHASRRQDSDPEPVRALRK